MARFALTLGLASLAVAPPPAAAAAAGSDFGAQAFAAQRAVGLRPGPRGFLLASYQEREALLELLRDPDPAMRRSAVRALRHYVAQTRDARERVLELYRDEREDLGVRLEAAKTLSYVANYNEVRESLSDYARGGRDAGLRALSYKALYFAAASSSQPRDVLREAARRESDKRVRLGAIWGLFLASNQLDVRDTLLDIALRDADLEARVEALKSLYHAMVYSEVRERIRGLARDSSEDAVLRVPAVLLLSAVVDSRARDLLVELARRGSHPALREAAVIALNPADERLVRYFHLTQRTDTGRYIDPLERE